MGRNTMGFTREQIRQFVHQYHLQPWGTKHAWLEQQPFTLHQMRYWRQLVYEGDLDRGLVPRNDVGMFKNESERDAYEEGRAEEIAAHRAEVDRLNARVRELEGANEALGKAIGLLHKLNAQEPDATPTESGPASS